MESNKSNAFSCISRKSIQLNEVIKNLKNIEHPKLKQIHQSLKPCLDALAKQENLINNWRSNITAHGKLYNDEIHGPVDITIRTKKFQKTVYLLTKLGNMYISTMRNNLTEEQKKAVKKLGKKWKSEAEIYIEDYFEQLQRASKIRKTVVTNLSKAGLNTDVSFVKYRSGRKIS